MLVITALIFSVVIFLVIRQLQFGYNTVLVARRALNSGSVKTSGIYELFKLLVKTIASINARFPIIKYRERLRQKLQECKSDKEYTPDEFLAYKEILALTGFIILIMLFEIVDMYTFGVALGLFYYPDMKIKNNKEKYEKEILKELPFLLDVITVCVEAGMTFDNALIKYISKARGSALRAELENYLKDVKIGKQRAEALKDISLRVNMRDFSSFISSIIQSERLGTSIAGTLRLQTRQIRIKRVQRIEKQALQAPVKLMLPLVLFIFPVIFIVIFGPVVIRLIKIF
ncbi:MAG: type II secretion system F family protein [Candidatus Firestonebacteria bacterium]